MWVGEPSQRISPSLGAQRPEMVLMVTDFPAPLSPTSAVILSAGIERSTLSRACTAPNALLTPRSSSSGAPSVIVTPPPARQRVRVWASRDRPPTLVESQGRSGSVVVGSTLPRRACRANGRQPEIPAAEQALAYWPAQ